MVSGFQTGAAGPHQPNRAGPRRRTIAPALLAAAWLGAATPAAACQLDVGWEPWPPYQIAGQNGPTGMDIAQMRAIAEDAGCAVQFERLPWARLLRQLEAGGMDIALAAAKSPERRAYAHFTAPYRHERVGVMVRAGDDAIRRHSTLKAILDAGRVVGVWRDYHYGPRVDELRDREAYAEQFSVMSNSRELLRQLARGRLDAVLGDTHADRATAQRTGLADQVTAHGMTVFTSPLHLMLSRRSVTARTRERLNAAIARLQERGRLSRIQMRYSAR